MQKPNISIPAFFDEIEKISSLTGATVGATIGATYLTGLGLVARNKKQPKTARRKMLRTMAFTGATIGGVMGSLAPLTPRGLASAIAPRFVARRRIKKGMQGLMTFIKDDMKKKGYK